MSRKKGKTTFYLVSWDEPKIVKFGFTELRRWLSFPGARLVVGLPFDNAFACYQFEDDIHHLACRTWPRAFTSAKEAVPYLGSGGAGWMECYHAELGHAVELVAFGCHDGMSCHDATSQSNVTMPRHDATSRCYGEKNRELTDVETGFCRSSKLLTVTRANTRQNFGGGVR